MDSPLYTSRIYENKENLENNENNENNENSMETKNFKISKVLISNKLPITGINIYSFNAF
jgi:hypothetical protein